MADKPRNPIWVLIQPTDESADWKRVQMDDMGFIWGHDVDGRHCRVARSASGARIAGYLRHGGGIITTGGMRYRRAV